MPRLCAGRLVHLLVWHALALSIVDSRAPLPSIYQEVNEESAPEDVAVQHLSSDYALGLAAGVNTGEHELDDEQPALPEAAQRNTTESKDFRNKFRRIKSPVRRLNRIMLLLRSEMGKVQLALEDAKDDCHRKKIPAEECETQKVFLELRGKLRRIRSAWSTVTQYKHEAALIQDKEAQAQKDLANATQYHNKATTMLSGRMIAIQDVDKRIIELKEEDDKNSKLEQGFQTKLNETWAGWKKASSYLRAVQGYDIKFTSALKGIVHGIKIGDDNAADDYESADDITKKAELIEARANLLNDKARRLEGRGKSMQEASTAAQVDYQENKDGILASDSYTRLDSFGKAHAHPNFQHPDSSATTKAQNFMSQGPPLLGRSMNKNIQSRADDVEIDDNADADVDDGEVAD